MSENTAATKRRYQRIAPGHLVYARRRFNQFATAAAVRAELKAQGHDYPYNALFYHWKQAAHCVCAETSSRNCPVHQDLGAAGDAQDGGE